MLQKQMYIQKQNSQKLPEYMGQIPPGPKEASWAVLFGSQGFILGHGEACSGQLSF